MIWKHVSGMRQCRWRALALLGPGAEPEIVKDSSSAGTSILATPCQKYFAWRLVFVWRKDRQSTRRPGTCHGVHCARLLIR